MKILLISSAFEDKVRSPIINDNSHYPLGLAYIHTYLEKEGQKVETLFLNDYSYNSCYQIVLDKLLAFQPEIVGFNILTSNRVSAYYLIEYIHNYYPKVKIILGGIHTSAMYKQLIEKYPYVVVVIGEGEVTMAELLTKIQNNETIDSVLGIAFRRGNEVVVNPSRPLINDLDQLPFPKHEIFFNPERINACILTTRGCPFRCSFCALDLISRRTVRQRSIRNVIAEIEQIITNNPKIKRIWIHDDTFFLSNERVIEFCNEIVKRDMRLEFVCSARFKPISEKVVSALEKAGFTNVMFGLESGSQSVLERAGKHITQQDVLYAIKLFKDSPIEVSAFLIVGLSGENDTTIKETIDFVMKIQKIKYIHYDEIGICFIYPATQLYDIAKRAGLIDDNYWLTDKSVPFYTVEHNEEQLVKYRELILDHIALTRLLTFKGFCAQTKMVPYIIKHVIKMPFFRRLKFFGMLVYRYRIFCPGLYRFTRSFYRKLKQFKDSLVRN